MTWLPKSNEINIRPRTKKMGHTVTILTSLRQEGMKSLVMNLLSKTARGALLEPARCSKSFLPGQFTAKISVPGLHLLELYSLVLYH